MKSFNPVIKWSGSKRSQANEIVSLAPQFETYYEPFLGGGSVLYAMSPQNAVCGDICSPLISLWQLIRNNPEMLCEIVPVKLLGFQFSKNAPVMIPLVLFVAVFLFCALLSQSHPLVPLSKFGLVILNV